jgi:hypothetical protein
MFVYVVTYEDINEYTHIECAFTSEKDALEYVTERSKKPDVGCYCYDYEKIILNGGSEN